jgi:hypothetical protein
MTTPAIATGTVTANGGTTQITLGSLAFVYPNTVTFHAVSGTSSLSTAGLYLVDTATNEVREVISYSSSSATVGTVTIGSAFSATAASVEFVRGFINPNGGDVVVPYNGGDNAGKQLHSIEGTQSQRDTTVTLDASLDLVEDASAASTTTLVLKALGDHLSKTHYDTVTSSSSTYRSRLLKTQTRELTRGTTESAECSGRGHCGEDGFCDCADGYKGEACESQTAFV